MRRVWVPLLLAGAGCARPVPEFDPAVLTDPRIIAVVAEPPEARPGAEVVFTLLAASAAGTLEAFEFRAHYCLEPKPLTDNNSVGAACWDAPGVPLAIDGASARGAIPSDACALFGPDPPPGDFRPRDPDRTGGYFVPLLLEAFGQRSVFLGRVRCQPADLGSDAAREYAARYVPNRNPAGAVLLLEATDGGGSATATLSLPADAAETFVVPDTLSQTVRDQVELLTVSWLVTAGTLSAASGTLESVEGGDWTASVTWEPAGAEGVHLYAVVRDSRGGVALAQHSRP